jgi:hypothetical protein
MDLLDIHYKPGTLIGTFHRVCHLILTYNLQKSVFTITFQRPSHFKVVFVVQGVAMIVSEVLKRYNGHEVNKLTRP